MPAARWSAIAASRASRARREGFLVEDRRRQRHGNRSAFRREQRGLDAVALLDRIDGYPRDRIPKFHLARGNYFTVAARSPFHHLIYPVPHAAGLGIHATLDLGKRVRFGPDVEWIDHIDYSRERARARRCSTTRSGATGRTSPTARSMPDYTGIRPKLHGPGEPQPDFRIETGGRPRPARPRESARHRKPGLHLLDAHR